MGQAAEANDENLYVLAIPATKEVQRGDHKETKQVRAFDKFLKHAEPTVPPDSRVPPVEVPPELREKFWGNSPEAERVRKDIIKASQVEEFRDRTVLIYGQSGSGKSVVAEEIHKHGHNGSKEGLHVLNCGAIPYYLFESLLFGIKGKIASGVTESMGLWEKAHIDKGTLFLDEIGEMAPDHQAKVLRVIEDKVIRRVGDLQERSVKDARVIAATNRDLKRMVKEGCFRLDLYTRLKQIYICVPELSPDPEDIEQFALRYWREVTGIQEASLSPEIIKLLTKCAWPGNMRELHHFMIDLYFKIYPNVEPSFQDIREYLALPPQAAITPALQGEGRKRNRGTPRPTMLPDRGWVERQVKLYKAELAGYTSLAQVLQNILQKMAPYYASLAIVQTRIRSIAEFAEKIQRVSIEKGCAALHLNDSCGARVIVQTTQDVPKVASFLEQYFEVDSESTHRPTRLANPGTFSSQQISYVVRLNRERANTLSSMLTVDIPDEAIGLWAEVQIRTVLDHAWANISRETTRGKPVPIAGKWASELTSLGDLLKAVDQSLCRIQKGLQIYSGNLSAYASREDLAREVDILQAALACDRGDVQVAARAGKLAMALGDWDLAIRFMSPFENSGYQPLMRDLGVAICQKFRDQVGLPEYEHGQRVLQAACVMSGSDPDAFASLAGTWKRRGDAVKARDLYLRAHVIDPADSYALGCYLELEMKLDPTSDIVTTMKPSIEQAIQRCRDLASAGVNLPWAYFDLGKFHLLLGRRMESFSAYSRAIQLSTSSHMIRTSLESLDLIREAKPETDHINEARRLLALGLAARFHSEVDVQELLREWPATGKPMAPVVIVTGHIDEAQAKTCELLIKEAFSNFSGTVIALACNEGLKETVSTMSRFTGDRGLQAWTDVIRSGIRPENVLVFCFGSGDTWAEQCFVALSMGSRVFAVQDPDAERAPLPSDENWLGVSDIQVAEADAIRKVLANFMRKRWKGKSRAFSAT
ncbi:MAG: sigma 54-interacting transcriptional regulator [Acidobacteria bacterium]|nr:sigma 54-interacting transcriptional regulator [Acidobacteriota bacterium]